MPLSPQKARERQEDLDACSKGHEAVRDGYMLGIQKQLGKRAFQDRKSRAGVYVWMLMFLTRPPSEPL